MEKSLIALLSITPAAMNTWQNAAVFGYGAVFVYVSGSARACVHRQVGGWDDEWSWIACTATGSAGAGGGKLRFVDAQTEALRFAGIGSIVDFDSLPLPLKATEATPVLDVPRRATCATCGAPGVAAAGRAPYRCADGRACANRVLAAACEAAARHGDQERRDALTRALTTAAEIPARCPFPQSDDALAEILYERASSVLGKGRGKRWIDAFEGEKRLWLTLAQVVRAVASETLLEEAPPNAYAVALDID